MKGRSSERDRQARAGLQQRRRAPLFEVRVGRSLSEHIDLRARVQAIMLVAIKQPTWSEAIELDAGPGGIGGSKADPLMGQFVLLLAPTVSFRYDF